MIEKTWKKPSKMGALNRRDFIKDAARIAAGLSAGTMAPGGIGAGRAQGLNPKEIAAVVPMPIQIVIDDVGWWSGHDGSKQQEPYRTGIPRNHVPEDYEAIAGLGRALGIRPQAAMILGEWDRNNILRTLPTSTWMGADWNNKKWVGPWLDQAADIIRKNSAYFEITMHGIGHEYWTDGKFTRAEWADANGTMRPPDQVEAHLDAYQAIMIQNQLSPFPSSFVPTAFLHGFGPTNGHKESIAEILSRRGVVYINTPFEGMRHRDDARYGIFGFDAGVITVDRGQDLLEWNSIGVTPTGELRGPTCGMHWPNLLHLDPSRNSEIVDGWVRFLRPLNDRVDTLLAANSESFRTQLIHHVCTQLTLTDSFVRLDFVKVDNLPHPPARNELTLKIKSPYALRLVSDRVKVLSEALAQRDGSYLYTLKLERIPGISQAQVNVAAKS